MMLCKFTGGPLDGMQRTLDDRDLDLTYVAHCYEATMPLTDIARHPPDYPAAWKLALQVRYVGRKWLGSNGQTVCIEYVYNGAE